MTDEKKFTKHVIAAVGAYKTLLDEYCGNGNSVSKLSAKYGISRNLLQQGFKKLVGQSIRDYKLKLRMERSRQLLQEGKDIKEIALLLHYTEARALSTAFKKYYGITPTDFMNSLAE
jgi:AraC-like DNA-binding protein